MAQVFLSIGSNIEREKHIDGALNALQLSFGELELSPVYESEAVGFTGDAFLNLVVSIQTELNVPELANQLRQIEDQHGRDREGPKFSSRTLDIDILTYGDCKGVFGSVRLPRDEITRNAFVLLPLSELAPGACHPLTQKTYQQLWTEFSDDKQRLWRVDFLWRRSAL